MEPRSQSQKTAKKTAAGLLKPHPDSTITVNAANLLLLFYFFLGGGSYCVFIIFNKIFPLLLSRIIIMCMCEWEHACP